MKLALCLLVGLLSLSSLPTASAADKTYPEKDPVLKFTVPEKWTFEVDEKDGSIAINSDDGRISVNFAAVPVEATMETFKELIPDMIKELKEAKVAEEAKEQTSDGLTGFSATYTAKVEDSPALFNFVMFKAGKERAILGNFVMADPATMPKEQGEKFQAFMKSLKGINEK